MSDPSNSAIKSLRERLAAGTEDRLGKALAELLENPLLTGTLGKAFDSREKMAQAQELAMGVLNLPSAADIERLTRRLRSVSQRLEGIEDGVHRLDRATVSRLSSIEDQLDRLADRLESRAAEPCPTASEREASTLDAAQPARPAPAKPASAKGAAARRAAGSGAAAKGATAKGASAKGAAAKRAAARPGGSGGASAKPGGARASSSRRGRPPATRPAD